jgi:GTP1/Obg family GTP-binding protein
LQAVDNEAMTHPLEQLLKDRPLLRDCYPQIMEAVHEIDQLRTALGRIRYTEDVPRSIERIALEALRKS